jgi:hypothetical protein
VVNFTTVRPITLWQKIYMWNYYVYFLLHLLSTAVLIFCTIVFSVRRQHKGKTQNRKVLLRLMLTTTQKHHLSLTITITTTTQWCMKVVMIKVKFQRPCAPMCSNHKLLLRPLLSLSFGGYANSSNSFLRHFLV